mmetsp:Transcript_37107/g.93275  ORF Transcript_37107/g.93275 Transcript_37107/m.93275 type:complete len:146 (+) Transcript_37107:458-895(+)
MNARAREGACWSRSQVIRSQPGAQQELVPTCVLCAAPQAMVNEAYAESPVEYRTGAGTPDEVVNPPGTNTGSCKIFYFAQLHGLAPEAALRLFCEHYRDVLDSPDGDSHANIRAFMKHGWEGVRFSGPALVSRAASEGAAPAEGI